ALIYMGFTSSAGAGNVYFISQPLASLQQAPSTSTVSPPSSQGSLIAVIIVIVVVVIIGAYLAVRRRH
ncbi:MAG: hypothetical protein RXQ96_08725, partial [Thermocladium sp.]